MSRFVLRFSGAGMAPVELARHLRSIAGVKVLDSSPRMFLIESAKPALEQMAEKLSGWQIVPESFTPLPDPRPKIGR